MGIDFGVVAQGRFNAKNSSTSLIFAADGITKLSKAVGRVEILYKGVILSTAKNTFAADGIFSMGVLFVPDVHPGGTATITVRVWDVTFGDSFCAAAQRGGGNSVSFDIVLADGITTPLRALDKFNGLVVRSGAFPLGSGFGVSEGGSRTLILYGLNTNFFGRPASTLTNLYPDTSKLGKLSGILPDLTYQSNSNFYGYDLINYQFLGVDVCSMPYPLYVWVSPSPERSGPALVAESTSGKVMPKLRGLDGHRYRIEKSADLSAWALAGEVTGNFSEVDLSPFLAAGDRAKFIRATEMARP